MKYLLLICTLLFVSLSANALDHSQSTSENKLPDSTKYTTYTPNNEFYFDDDFDTSPSNTLNPSKAVGGAIVGGMVGFAIFQITNCEDETGANGDDKVWCEMGKTFGGMILGIPLGALLGYNLTASYSNKNKSAFISTQFEF